MSQREVKGKSPVALAGLFALVSMGFVVLVLFQNCAPLETENPLFDSDMSVGCVGPYCEPTLSAVKFQSTVSGIMIDPKTGSSSASTCDNTTCFDLGGFCDTAGYPGSVFVYQWILGGVSAIAEVRTAVACNDGRFNVLVKVPFSSFDWTQAHRLRLYMKVINEEGVELVNPTGTAEWTYIVTVRTP